MLARRLAVLGASVAGLALMAGPALASAPYTVTNSGTNPLVFTNKATVNLAANGNNLPCTSSSLSVTVHTGTFSDPANIATIDPASFTGCTFAGFPTTVTAVTPWQLIATGGNTSGTSDTITGTLTGISANINISGPFGACKFNVAGTVSGTFLEDNGKGGQELSVTSSNLTISGVNTALTCLGLVSNGNAASFTGAYNISGHPIQVS
jgi:hypothetical protein